MKKIICIGLPVAIFSLGLGSCEKEKLPVPKENHYQSKLVFYDHYNGEELPNLEVFFVAAPTSLDYYQLDRLIVQKHDRTDINGQLQFEQFRKPTYLQINAPNYLKILYAVNGYKYNNAYPYASDAEFIKTENNTSYYRAEIYRMAAVDIHIKQVTNLKGVQYHIFGISIYGSQRPDAAGNLFMGEKRFSLSNPSSPLLLDTTIRVYAYGDTKNIIRWTRASFDDFENGDSEEGEFLEKIYSSDSVSQVTITF
jgi:hypothetical protein